MSVNGSMTLAQYDEGALCGWGGMAGPLGEHGVHAATGRMQQAAGHVQYMNG